MSTNFKGKVIAITGAASGIGLATSRMLASRGAILAMASWKEGSLNSAVEEIKSSTGATVTGTVLNVADRTAVDSWISATVEQHGRLDGAVNLAAVIGPTIGISNIEDLPDSEWDFIMDVNLKGVFNCMRAQLKAMKSLIAEGEGKEGKQKGGSIVNGASIGGIMGLQHNSAYVASKHAVVGLTRAAAKECGSGGVRVNAIAPGIIDTPMLAKSKVTVKAELLGNVPMGRIGTADEAAELICWLLCDGSSYVTGTVQSIDGGWAC